MIRNPLRLIAGATGALLLSACASTAGNTGGGDAISHPRGREDLVVRIDVGGGFVPVEQTVTAGGSSLSYDALADQYVYVWKSDKAWAGTCRRLDVTLSDGTRHVAHFKFAR